MSTPDRRELVDRQHGGLSVRRQCRLLGLARSGVYRPALPADDNDVAVMRRLDELFTAWPFLGSRRMAQMLKEEGFAINRKRVQRLMRQMGIAALGPKPRTTKPQPGHKIFPYLLRNLAIDRPNQVWAADITYIPIGRGFLYLVAVIDWASRAVLAFRLSNTMDVSFCVAALEEALARFGKPEIFNTDQGSQFTSQAFTGTLAAAGIQISMENRAGHRSHQERTSHGPQLSRPQLRRCDQRRPRRRRLQLPPPAQLAEVSLAPASGCPFGSAQNRRSVKSELFTDDDGVSHRVDRWNAVFPDRTGFTCHRVKGSRLGIQSDSLPFGADL